MVAVIATRLPFMTQTLYAFDSANYALAIRDGYNVAFHRPQPPGSPVYVAVAWSLNVLAGDPNRALVLESIGLSALAVASTTLLGRALFGRAAGLLAGLLLLFTVGFWGYGEVAYPYVGLAAESATLAWLAYTVIAGRRWLAVPLGVALGLSAGIRWDGAVFAGPLWLWALSTLPWRLRLLSVAAAAAVVVGWAVPMVQLSGGPAAYLAAVSDYLRVWAPQSAYVPGADNSGQATLAGYNLNFFVNYVRQMLGVGVLLLLYALGKRFGPGRLAVDLRSRFLLVWLLPPMVVYVLTHLGEPGYVLSLAPQVATIGAISALDLGEEVRAAAAALRARGWRWLPTPRVVARGAVGLLLAAILGWNVQAFLRGVGPGRLPDLRARDATTAAQVAFLRGQAPAETVVLAHDTLRQMEYYLPDLKIVLQYSEYAPGWENAATRTELPSGTTRVVVLDTPLEVPPQDAERVRLETLRDSPPVTVTVVDVRGTRAIEHGYRRLRVLP